MLKYLEIGLYPLKNGFFLIFSAAHDGHFITYPILCFEQINPLLWGTSTAITPILGRGLMKLSERYRLTTGGHCQYRPKRFDRANPDPLTTLPRDTAGIDRLTIRPRGQRCHRATTVLRRVVI